MSGVRFDPWKNASQTKLGAFRNLPDPVDSPPLTVHDPTRELIDTVIFVDAVQRTENTGFTDRPDEPPAPVLLISFAAGAAITRPLGSGRATFEPPVVNRVILSEQTLQDIHLDFGSMQMSFQAIRLPDASPETADDAISTVRSDLELGVAQQLLADHPDALIVVDGQLPAELAGNPRVVGWLKSVSRFPGPATWLPTLNQLTSGQYTNTYQSQNPNAVEWFVAARNPLAHEHAGAHLVRLQAGNTLEPQIIQRLQAWSSLHVPRYASCAIASTRAPQQPAAVEKLEEHLRRYLGDRQLIARKLLHQAPGLVTAPGDAPPGEKQSGVTPVPAAFISRAPPSGVKQPRDL